MAYQKLAAISYSVAERYGAIIEKSSGQGFFMIFGIPYAYEDDAERSMQAAIEILSELRAVQARKLFEASIGASSGRIYYRAASPLASQTLIGPCLNLASRLQTLAAPNQILGNKAIYRQAKRAFEFQILGNSNSLVNPNEEIYQLRTVRETPGKLRSLEGIRSEIIGRSQELRLLQSKLELAIQGQGHSIALSGEAGIGKSGLVAELRQSAISVWEGFH